MHMNTGKRGGQVAGRETGQEEGQGRGAGGPGEPPHVAGRIEKSQRLPHIIIFKDEGLFKSKDAIEVLTKTP